MKLFIQRVAFYSLFLILFVLISSADSLQYGPLWITLFLFAITVFCSETSKEDIDRILFIEELKELLKKLGVDEIDED